MVGRFFKPSGRFEKPSYQVLGHLDMAMAGPAKLGLISALGGVAVGALTTLGDFAIFSWQTFGWALRRKPAPRTLLPSLYLVGVRSVPVVAITGMFIGMVMAV